MWSSIQQIIKPDSISEALQLQNDSASVLFAGGSYLVAQKDLNTTTLVDINHLLTEMMEDLDGQLYVGAGITLQDLVAFNDQNLINAIMGSCPSKNIRNQRTLGGEIAEARPDSDLMVYLYATGAKLQINDVETFISIHSWDRLGVITKVLIPRGGTILERVSVLDSAAAFVIVAVRETPDHFILAVGGKADKICYCRTGCPPSEDDIRQFLEEVESIFTADHFGSPAYKRQVVSNLLTEMTVKL